MKKTLFAILLCGMLLSLASCEKALMADDIAPTPTNTFGYLWKKFDQQYAMFDVKVVDWNAMYDSLYPLVSDTMDADSLFSVCATLLKAGQLIGNRSSHIIFSWHQLHILLFNRHLYTAKLNRPDSPALFLNQQALIFVSTNYHTCTRLKNKWLFNIT